MDKIICLTDYKNHFGSKWNASPYRSGLDKEYLDHLFLASGYNAEFIPMGGVDFFDPSWKGSTVLYTSSEEYGYHYKCFIEDIILGLDRIGAQLVPRFDFLRANNNKVYMEILRQVAIPEELNTLKSQFFGTYEELNEALEKGQLTFPCVLKTASGSMSRGVSLAHDKQKLLRQVKKIGHTSSLSVKFKEKIRSKRHRDYKIESSYQRKFIIQPFVNNLTNDWKVLIYGNRYFVLRRNIRKNDFRASGSGYNYTSGSDSGFPVEMLNLIRKFFLKLNTPNLSVDFAYDGKNGYIFEFQGIYFGTSTQYKSKDYYEYVDGDWEIKENRFDQEQVYVDSIVDFLRK